MRCFVALASLLHDVFNFLHGGRDGGALDGAGALGLVDLHDAAGEVLDLANLEPALADEYREFSDWYARLNAMFRPQALLPFPRLMVNQQLAQKKLIPEKVSLRIGSSAGVGESPLELESRHEVRVGLLNQDRERIAWLESCLRKFSEVELVAYQAQDGAEKK